jgi:hypothetical protein
MPIDHSLIAWYFVSAGQTLALVVEEDSTAAIRLPIHAITSEQS